MMKSSPLFAILAFSVFCISSQGQDPVSVLGYLDPFRSIDMNASESGLIHEIIVSEGDTVEKGEALLKLNTAVLEAQLSIAKVQAESDSAIAVANAELSVAQERYSKLAKLKRSGTAHSGEVIRAEAELKKAKAQVSIAEEEKKIAGFRVEEMNAQIERRILRSPIPGVVLEINRDIAESSIGSQNSGQSRPLIKVAQIDKLRLVVHVPALYATNLKVGEYLPVKVLQQNSLSLDRENAAIDTQGMIEFVSPAIDPSSETLRTRLVIDNAAGQLKSGSHALVFFDEKP